MIGLLTWDDLVHVMTWSFYAALAALAAVAIMDLSAVVIVTIRETASALLSSIAKAWRDWKQRREAWRNLDRIAADAPPTSVKFTPAPCRWDRTGRYLLPPGWSYYRLPPRKKTDHPVHTMSRPGAARPALRRTRSMDSRSLRIQHRAR